uniref:Uncharacterized protein n=1 Tax=Cacopsylla melanoneura TaxID=428564 RepID=A0A8D8X8M7_9HEMI
MIYTNYTRPLAKTHKYDDEFASNNKLGTESSPNSKNNMAFYKQRGPTKTSSEQINYPEVQVAKSFLTMGGQKNGKSGEARAGQEKSDKSGVRVWFDRVKNGVEALSGNLTDGMKNIFSSRVDDETKKDDSSGDINSILSFIWTVFIRGADHIKKTCFWIYRTTCQYCNDFWNGLSRFGQWKPCVFD